MHRELRVVIFDRSEPSSELISVYLKEIDSINEVEIYNDFVKGYEFCTNNPPDFAVIDISENSEFALDIISKISKAKIPVIVTSASNSSGTIIKSLRAGATEFLTRPIIKTELINAVNKILTPTEIDYDNDCKIISLFSGKGGSGKTTIALNLALELAKQTGKKTALIDLNFILGELAEFLNLPPTFNLSNMLENIEKWLA